MALYAFDGTWNELKKEDEHSGFNTNVVEFFQAYDGNSDTINFYVAGVGTRFDVLGKVFGGAFGLGERPRLNEAYDHLCAQWAAGDHVIDIVGFSRGAATTLDFCHMIQDRKIRQPGSTMVVEANPEIRFLGIWDVVAAFGLANLGFPDFNFGHHLEIPKNGIQFAFHALALDERRPSFLPTRLRGAYECWFRGVHSDVGGGNGNTGLNDIALKWMMCKARAAGLPITDSNISALQPDPDAPAMLKSLPFDVRIVSGVDRRHYTVGPQLDCRSPPDSCFLEAEIDEQQALPANAVRVLSAEERDRVIILTSVAEAQARALAFPFDGGREPIFSLIEHRIPLVTDDAALLRARESTIRLVRETVARAKVHQFHALNDFFVTEALFRLRPLFPFTDD